MSVATNFHFVSRLQTGAEAYATFKDKLSSQGSKNSFYQTPMSMSLEGTDIIKCNWNFQNVFNRLF